MSKLHRCDDGHVEEVDLRESRRPDFVAPASRSEPYLPYVTHPSVLGDEIVLDRFGTPLTVSQVAQKLEIDFIQCLALPVVQPVLDLISHGLWKTIPCMGRWLPLLVQLPPQVQMQVHFGSEPPRPEYGVLSPHQVREVATLIQEFAPEILRSARQRCDGAEAISVEARLHHSLTWLSSRHNFIFLCAYVYIYMYMYIYIYIFTYDRFMSNPFQETLPRVNGRNCTELCVWLNVPGLDSPSLTRQHVMLRICSAPHP